MAMYNLLTRPLFSLTPGPPVTLPGLLASLAQDGVDGFPALRPHQDPAWHAFLVQLAALALHRASLDAPPVAEDRWRDLLRGLTPDFPDDEPWCLVVADESRPAFLQPALPTGVSLPTPVASPDALDLLITSKNHDLKQAVARHGKAEDYVYALVSLQTGEGYGGRDNYGISRMNGGSSSRPLLGLAPADADNPAILSPRPGAWWRRDVLALLTARHRGWTEGPDFPERGGHALLWLPPWPEGEQLRIDQLDPWYIEVCRRVRVTVTPEGGLQARKGTSKAPRIAAKELNGVVGDPWAPVHKADHKSFTLSGRDFDYKTLRTLLFSGDWALPLLAKPAPFEPKSTSFVLVAAALARGNSKTEGFKRRELPLSGRAAYTLTTPEGRQSLDGLAQQQVAEIDLFDHALRDALALVAAAGEWNGVGKPHYAHTLPARAQLDRAADDLFFHHLWRRFDAQSGGEAASEAVHRDFAESLWSATRTAFDSALPAIPCPARFRPRAEARARRRLWGDKRLRQQFPALFTAPQPMDTPHPDHQEESADVAP